jgi:hypothetical protein
MNGSERDRKNWAFRLVEITRYVIAARDFVVGEDYELALVMLMHADEEMTQVRRAILPYAGRPTQ